MSEKCKTAQTSRSLQIRKIFFNSAKPSHRSRQRLLPPLPSATIDFLPRRDKLTLKVSRSFLRQSHWLALHEPAVFLKLALDPFEVFFVIGGTVDDAANCQCATHIRKEWRTNKSPSVMSSLRPWIGEQNMIRRNRMVGDEFRQRQRRLE